MVSARRFHYLVSIGGFVFILSTTITGLLWAYAPYLYWEDNYLQKKNEAGPSSILSPELKSPEELFSRSSLKGAEVNLTSISYKNLAGFNTAELCIGKNKSLKCVLLNANTGEQITPLSEDIARTIAKEFVPAPLNVKSSNYIEKWEHRKEGIKPGVWVISFDDPKQTEIVVDAFNGKVIEDQDKYRRFHFFIMKLHQFSFFGTHKELVVLSGIPLLLLLFSGVRLMLKRFKLR